MLFRACLLPFIKDCPEPAVMCLLLRFHCKTCKYPFSCNFADIATVLLNRPARAGNPRKEAVALQCQLQRPGKHPTLVSALTGRRK